MNKKIRGKLSEVEWAYIAGLVDGEGCIGIHRHTDNRGVSKLHYLYMVISNNNPLMYKFLNSKIGGIVRKRQQRKEWNINYTWSVQRRDLEWFLRGVYPYLLLKKDHAILALKFLKERQKYAVSKNGKEHGHPLTIKEQKKREDFYIRMRKLTQRYTKPKPHQKLQPQRLNEKTS